MNDCCEKAEKEVLVTVLQVSTRIISLFDTEQKRIVYMQLINRIKSEMDDDVW